MQSHQLAVKTQLPPAQPVLWTPRGPVRPLAASVAGAAAAPSPLLLHERPTSPRAAVRCAYTTSPSWADRMERWTDMSEEQLVMGNQSALTRLARRVGEEAAIDALLLERPALLQVQMTVWLQFLKAYGVKDCDVAKLLLTTPELFERSNVHSAGLVILAFKQLGWSDHHVAGRLVPLYPRLLANTVQEMQRVVDELERAGCCGEHLRLIAWEVPKIFSRHTFRRYMRQFQALGVYGLSRHAEGGASSRAVAATMMLHPFG